MKKIDNMRTNTKGLAASFCFLLSAFSFPIIPSLSPPPDASCSPAKSCG